MLPNFQCSKLRFQDVQRKSVPFPSLVTPKWMNWKTSSSEMKCCWCRNCMQILSTAELCKSSRKTKREQNCFAYFCFFKLSAVKIAMKGSWSSRSRGCRNKYKALSGSVACRRNFSIYVPWYHSPKQNNISSSYCRGNQVFWHRKLKPFFIHSLWA